MKKGIANKDLDKPVIDQHTPKGSEIPNMYVRFTLSTHILLMLTLDQTTLYYFSRSDLYSKDIHGHNITDWNQKVPKGTKPGSSHSIPVPSLTSGPTYPSLPQSIWSALTNDVRITSYNDGIKVVEGGVPYRDETKSSE